MPKKYYTAMLPEGGTITRGTERTYTHAVVYRQGLAELLAFANGEGWAKTERANWAYYNGNTVAPLPVVDQAAWKTAQAIQKYTAAVAFIAKYPTPDDCVADRLAGRIEYAGKVAGKWNLAGWCGRHDLAVKLAAKIHHCADKVVILEAKLF